MQEVVGKVSKYPAIFDVRTAGKKFLKKRNISVIILFCTNSE